GPTGLTVLVFPSGGPLPRAGPPQQKGVWGRANRSGIDAKGPSHIDQRFALCEPLQGLLTLMLIKLSGASKAYPTRLGALSAIVGAGFDQVPLESSEAGQDCDQQLALRSRRIAPRAVQRFELGALLG